MRHICAEKHTKCLDNRIWCYNVYMIEIERISPLTGITNKMYMDISAEQVEEWNRALRRKTYPRSFFPNPSEDEREFIMTGYTLKTGKKKWRRHLKMVKT